MADFEGPWGGAKPPPPPPEPRRRVGLIVWLAVMAAAAVLLLVLLRLFPGQLSGARWTDAAYLLGLLALVSSGLVAARRFNIAQTLRHAGVWLMVFALALLGYAYRGEISAVALRVRSALIPAYAVSTSPHATTVSRSEDGAFYINGAVDGVQLKFIIDSGATDIVLSPADAERLGLDLSAIKFLNPAGTANGVGYSAPFTARTLTVGPFVMRDVRMQINQKPMEASLLGMPFLQRLHAEIQGDRMILKDR